MGTWLWILVILTRVALAANYPHFFDSPEYLKLATSPLSQVFSQAHSSLHPISMLIWQFVGLFPPSYAVFSHTLISAIFGVISIWIAAKIAGKYRGINVNVVILALTLFPLLWMLQTNIASEPVTHLFMLLTWYGWLRYGEKQNIKWLLFTTAVGSLAIFNYIGVVIWLLGLCLIDNKRVGWKRCLVVALSMVVGSAMWWMLLTMCLQLPLLHILAKMFGESRELSQILTSRGAIHAIYQSIVAASYSFTPIAVATYLLYIWFNRKRGMILPVLLVGLMYLVSVSWWHGGVFGRIGGFVAYPLAMLIGSIPRKWGVIVVIGLIPWWIYTVRAYQLEPVPEITKGLIESCGYRENDQLIVADTERPQLSEKFPTLIAVNNSSVDLVITKLHEGSKDRIFLTSQAISYPFRQYDGQLPHPLQGRKGKQGHIESLKLQNLKICAENSRFNLAVYQLD